ncbi:MAG: ATP-grasp domain-containing protein [Phycisphaeraceae bacterium]
MNNIFVIGLDKLNHRWLQRLPNASQYHFHQLLTFEQLQQGPDVPITRLIDEAEARLASFEGSIDAIVSYWDFPGTLLVPILTRRFNCPGPTLEATLKCEHKYWSRYEQAKVTDACPAFEAVNPYDDDAFEKLSLEFPYWVKPVKSFLGHLSYRIKNEADFRQAMPVIRQKIPRIGEPFNHILGLADLPEAIVAVDGYHCLAEADIWGTQGTLEGYVHDGKLHSHGVVDSICYPGTTVFSRLEYPSRLPAEVQQRVADIVETVIHHLGYEDRPFNVEFFWDQVNDKLWLLEINPRVSQSHALLFEQVDGVSNFHVPVELALGNTPTIPHRAGPAGCAAKFSVRAFRDGIVRSVPTAGQCHHVEALLPGTVVEVTVRPGDRLSALLSQDSYSYLLAEIIIGAPDQAQLLERYEQCLRLLPFVIEDIAEPVPTLEMGQHENRGANAA